MAAGAHREPDERHRTARAPHRPGRLVCGRRTKWLTVLLWLVALAALAPAAQRLSDVQDNDALSWLPDSAESTRVLKVAEGFRDESVTAVVIYAREGGLTAADRERIAGAADELRTLRDHGVQGARTRGPVFDRPAEPRAAQIAVPITMDERGWERIAPAVDSLREITGRGSGGLAVHITGPGGTAADFAEVYAGIDSTLLLAALAVVVVALLVTYRSPVLLLVPVLAAVAALLTSQALVYLLARHAGLTVNGQSAGILTVLVFGAGTDYALLLVARYREELRRHRDRHEAMARALRRAGPAIVASGGTVGISMLVLLVAEMNSTSGLGPVCAVGVAVAVLAMLTLLPALLVIAGRWVFWPVVPHYGSPEPTERGVWARAGRRIERRPRTVWGVTAVVLAALSLGITALRAEGIDNADAFTRTQDSVTGQELSARYFPAGSGSPLVVVAEADRAGEVRRAVERAGGVVPASVGRPPGVAPERDGRVLLEATPTDPADSAAAEETVERVRAAVHAVPGARALVGGTTAATLDAENASARDNRVVIPLVLLVVLGVLMLLLRAVLAPLLLIATVVLSFAAALGISALAFRHVFDYAGEDTAFPLFTFVFLVALGIDYNIFLTTRVREESVRRGTRQGTLTALAATGAVITSAGLVLAGTFAALGTLPVTGFAEIGFAVAAGVLLDTFVVRSVLVTAVFLDLGPRVWWPHPLARTDGGRRAGTAGPRRPDTPRD
ncbi:MMPL family transporter [Streptomyces pactum]|uniref:MMPL family transporter n=1 Tax=Streptomyces pactum TaxID=68249 RepID=A0ABS0NRY9_9ACTN|nr:MMPL family transporter [Streptomyces pactum]MBH5337987.1 MMPL family transporter [Streptomyces pactum]